MLDTQTDDARRQALAKAEQAWSAHQWQRALDLAFEAYSYEAVILRPLWERITHTQSRAQAHAEQAREHFKKAKADMKRARELADAAEVTRRTMLRILEA